MKRGFEGVERALSSATAMGSTKAPLTMPWEINSCMKGIFGASVTPWLEPVSLPRALPPLGESAVTVGIVSLQQKKKVCQGLGFRLMRSAA